MIILAIESSCDDTGAAIIRNGKILSNVVSSQAIHGAFGGVVPELASRAHQTNIVPVVEAALNQANINKSQLDAIAFTQGPGLLGSLLVGMTFSKAFALGLGVPIITVDHLHAHIAAHFIDQDHAPKFPFLCLLVSGGHTLIIRVDDYLHYEIIGRTTDDAAGEAFDKAAKIMSLPYPGGPLIDKYAKEGNIHKYQFTEPKISGLDFSFSGLKTAFLYFVRNNLQKDSNFLKDNLADICASYQHRIVSYLLNQLQKASEETGIKEIGIAGGVAANSYLRAQLTEKAKHFSWNVYIPDFQYCTDNAGMVAMSAHFKYEAGIFAEQNVGAYTRQGQMAK
ncbi:MAG: tRNA (adenosine(37)-N6)-threonylcarbamoyltransferase complex transferase subunit TsaD [Sphingobacteriales bacterium]|nr:MAG: tRNA (adenosine(37)-N6)-threonylcarbamoyltransferase complex transferase subunit TsaD [Sphingobacteriales bacterium]